MPGRSQSFSVDRLERSATRAAAHLITDKPRRTMAAKIVHGRYRIHRKIGSGAFSDVYSADDLQSRPNRNGGPAPQVALKRLTVATQSELDGVLKEVETLRKVKHFHVVSCQDFFVYKEKLCIVMEMATGGDLHDMIHQQRRKMSVNFSETNIASWFSQLCLGLSHIHDNKVLHRDIKAKNILVFPSKSLPGGVILKLGDFGLARAVQTTDNYMAQTSCGTPYNMSPELMQSSQYSFASDVWSMGTVLFEMCTFEPPFKGKDMRSLRQAIIRSSPPVLPRCYSTRLQATANSMLEKRWERRPTVKTILDSSYMRLAMRNNEATAATAATAARKKLRPITVCGSKQRGAQRLAQPKTAVEDAVAKIRVNGDRAPPVGMPKDADARGVPHSDASFMTRKQRAEDYADKVRNANQKALHRKQGTDDEDILLHKPPPPPTPSPAAVLRADHVDVKPEQTPACPPTCAVPANDAEGERNPSKEGQADDDDEDGGSSDDDNIGQFLASVRQFVSAQPPAAEVASPVDDSDPQELYPVIEGSGGSSGDDPSDQSGSAKCRTPAAACATVCSGQCIPDQLKAEDIQPPVKQCWDGPGKNERTPSALHAVIKGPADAPIVDQRWINNGRQNSPSKNDCTPPAPPRPPPPVVLSTSPEVHAPDKMPELPAAKHQKLRLSLERKLGGHDKFCGVYFLLEEANKKGSENRGLVSAALHAIIGYDSGVRQLLDDLYADGYLLPSASMDQSDQT